MSGHAVVNMAGRLTDNPEVRYRSNGDPVASFCVAVGRTIKSDFHSRNWVDYIDCINVGEKAMLIAQSFCKGEMVELCGYLTQVREEKRGYKKNYLVVDVVTIEHVRSAADIAEPACT